MARPRVVVLWEDSLAKEGKPANFGPHGFLAACVADRLSVGLDDPMERWYELRHGGLIESNHRNGVDNLLKELGTAQLYQGGRHVVAVVDDDRVRERLHGDGAPQQEIAARSVQPELTHVFLIERNLESLIERIRDVGAPIEPAELHRACAVKDMNARDRILNRFGSSPDRRDLRARVCQAAPGWTGWPALVAWLTDHLRTATGLASPSAD